MEFLVHADIKFPEVMGYPRIRKLLDAEARACRPYMDAGIFTRAWRTYGDHQGSHGHVSLWDAPSEEYIRQAYEGFPLVQAGILTITGIVALQVNPNDPGSPATERPDLIMNYPVLRSILDQARFLGTDTAMEHGVWIVPGIVSVHDHPGSYETSRQIHFMVHDGDTAQKVAELGPPAEDGETRAPGYVDFLAEWAGRPVHHRRWVARIKQDNRLVHDDYDAALNGSRQRREVQ